MDFHNSDGRVLEDPDGDWSPGADTHVGDVAWFEEDILLVVRVDGNRADTVEHPKAEAMMAAVFAGGTKEPINKRMAAAMQIHWRYIAELAAPALERLRAEHPVTDPPA